jgi:hypothetical protein
MQFQKQNGKAMNHDRKRWAIEAGLPGGIFSYQKFLIWVYFGGPWNGKNLFI